MVRPRSGVRVLLAYDGSPAAVASIEVGARLFPSAEVVVTYLWTPPFASAPLRRRLIAHAETATQLAELLEREGSAEAERVAGTGAVLAEAAGWRPEPIVRRSFGGDGYRFAGLAEEISPDVVLAGSRGETGVGALLDSFTDQLVHHSPRPVLVVPHPLLVDDRDRATSGPVVVGWDGSPGASAALCAAASLFTDRELIAVTAGAEDEVRPAGPVDGRSVRTVRAEEVSGLPGPGRGRALALVGVARSHAAAVVVTGSRGRSTAAEVLLGSTAMAVLHHAHMPVLVVPRRPAGPPGVGPGTGN